MKKSTKKDKDKLFTKWAGNHKYSVDKKSRENFDIVDKWRDRLEESEQYKRTCWKSRKDGDIYKKWDNNDSLYKRDRKVESDGRTNIKSPAAQGRIDSVMTKLKSLNIRWAAQARDEKDIGRDRVAQIVLDEIFEDAMIREPMWICENDALKYGNGFGRMNIRTVIREYRYPKKDTSKMTKEEKEKVEKGEVIFGKKEKKIKYKGLAIEPIRNRDFFPQPYGKSINGNITPITYGIYRRIMHIDDFKREFGDRVDKKTLEKIKTSSFYAENNEDKYYANWSDVKGDDMVCVLECEDEAEDEYVVIANDILAIHSPLPLINGNNDTKQLSFFKFDCFGSTHDFYCEGFCDKLEQSQGAEEVLVNLAIDHVIKQMDQKYLINKKFMGDIANGYLEEDSIFIPINILDGNTSIQQGVVPMQNQPISFDFFKMSEKIDRMQTIASAIDPSQMNLQVVGKTATATMVEKEKMEIGINALNVSFSTTLNILGQQAWNLIPQIYNKEEIKEILGSEKEETPFKKIRLDGIKIDFKKDDVKILEDEDFDLDFLDLSEEKESLKSYQPLDIKVKAESLEIKSKALEAQKAMEAYKQFMMNAVDPADPDTIQKCPLPLFNAVTLARNMVKKVGYDDEILLQGDLKEKREIEEAVSEINRMQDKDEYVQGVPGRSQKHIEFQAKVLMELTERRESIEEELDEISANQPPPMINPFTGMPEKQEENSNPVLEEEFDRVRSLELSLADHIMVDKMPRYAVALSAVENTKEQEQMPMQAPPQGPQGMMPPQQGMAPQGINMQDVMPGMGGVEI